MSDAICVHPLVWQRFWEKVDRTGDCWLWTASLNAYGYGRFRYQGEARLAHRLSYMFLVGPIPAGVSLDHMCHNADRSCPGNAECLHRSCVNPAHLAFANHQENAARSPLVGGKTHCKQGHEFTPENTTMNSGARRCKTCHRETANRHYHERRSA